jgi:biopolymer transport protein ExbD
MSKFKTELRRAIRAGQVEPEVNFLNITAMLDIMTIILVFLLKTLGESSAAIPQSDDLRLPLATIEEPATEDGVRVIVSKSQIMVGDDRIMTLPGRDSLAQTGVGAMYKRSGPNDLYIVPLGNALQAARRTDKAIRAAKGLPGASEAIVICDSTTPYRLFIEVLFTLGQNEFGKFHLMTIQSKKRPP